MRRIVVAVGFLAVLSLMSTAGSASAAVKRWGVYGGRNGLPARHPTAVPFPPEAGTIIKVDAGNAASYALSSNGTLWAFGLNENGELGDGKLANSTTPVQVIFPAGTRIVAIGEGRASGFAVDSTGQGWAWGRVPRPTKKAPPEGKVSSLCLGRSVTSNVLTPQKVPGVTQAQAVQGGGTHTVWLMRDGTVQTCGANDNGQLGIGSNEDELLATPVPGLANVVEVSAGKATTCARTENGEIYDWGANDHGQIGNSEEENEEENEGEGEEPAGAGVSSPFHVPLPGPASEISCGGNRSGDGGELALVGGQAYGWGEDEEGEAGDEQTTNKPTPTLASATTSLNLVQVVESGSYSLGLSANGNVYGWGSNVGFTLAMPPRELELSLSPRLIDTGATEISATSFDSVDR